MYTTGTCAQGYKTFVPGRRIVYRLALGDAVTLGGTLTLSTCGLTRNNTVMYVGTGCPNAAFYFGCLRGGDDAGSTACSTNPLASTLSLVADTRFYFVQVGASSGADFVSGLSWSYSAPSAMPTSSRTSSRTGSKTKTKTRTRTATASRSRSRKAKQVL